MKRQIKWLLAFFALAMALAGCGKDAQEANAPGNTAGGSLSKGEWIGMLGDSFGYNEALLETDAYSDVNSGYEYYPQIQACSEWGVITEQETFDPDASVTWEYALQTAVRAVGIDRIASAGVAVSEDTLVDFFNQNIANTGNIDLNGGISKEDAEQLLGYALDYMYALAPVERFEYTYNEDVYEATPDGLSFRGDGRTAIVTDGTVYQAGDVIYLTPTMVNTAEAIKVTEVNGNELTYVLAELEDVYSELQISGTYEGIIISVESADMESTDVSFRNTDYGPLYCGNPMEEYRSSSLVNRTGGYEMVQTKASINGNSAHFEVGLGDNGSFTIDVDNISVSTDIDFGIVKGLKKAYATINFDDTIKVSYEAEHYSKSIPLGDVNVQLGSTPCSLKLSLVLNIGFDGEASLTYTSHVVGSIGYKKGSGLQKSLDNQNPTLDFHAQATATAEPTAKADLRVLNRSIANLKVTAGVVAIATVDVDLMGNQPACIDIYLYVPLRWAVNEDGCIMTNISNKLKYSQVIWDSENSAVTMHFHWEDGTEVGECTRGTEEKIETPPVDENGEPYDEYKIFEFEELDFGVIRLATMQVILDEGESLTIGVVSVPNGYQASDLVYAVEDSSVCNVSGGVVTAGSNGSTVVKISTPDGKYNTYITVTVNGGYNDTSGFQSL